jgi:hypothetical protein
MQSFTLSQPILYNFLLCEVGVCWKLGLCSANSLRKTFFSESFWGLPHTKIESVCKVVVFFMQKRLLNSTHSTCVHLSSSSMQTNYATFVCSNEYSIIGIKVYLWPCVPFISRGRSVREGPKGQQDIRSSQRARPDTRQTKSGSCTRMS